MAIGDLYNDPKFGPVREVDPEAMMAAAGRGGVFVAVTLHDDDCPAIATPKGACRCIPDDKLVEVLFPGKRKAAK